ncbi:MAG TPA: hypothetical protein VMR34_00105 [Candidatus Saccharimonadales bacterium]|nr:hypothetical protein [Candidatus Saccharimonadales bacterium]
MIKKINNQGFGLVEVLITVFVIVLLGVVGGLIYKHYHNSSSLSQNSSGIGLTIERENTLNQPGVSNFTKKVSGSSALTILNDIDSLKSTPSGIYNCPMDDGVEYTFTFTNPSLTATASTTGCRGVTIDNKSYVSTDKFWNDVSSATRQPIDPGNI